MRSGSGGRVAVRATAADMCVYTKRSRRLAARGMLTWGDITHKEGRWLTWAEAAEVYVKDGSTSAAADVTAYEKLIEEITSDRWSDAREKWWAIVRRGEGRTA